MSERNDPAGLDEELVRDYERVAALGVKRTSDLPRGGAASGVEQALERLLVAGCAAEQHGAIVLRRPDDCGVPVGTPRLERMLARYRVWLRADSGGPAQPARGGAGPAPEGSAAPDELLYGELGFWQHWWNRIRERDYEARGPLPMDIVVPDDGSFEERSWLAEFDPEIRAHVLHGRLMRGRAIVPPAAVRSAVEPMLDLSAESGVAVRVLSTEARFVLYDECVAVLPAPTGRSGDPLEAGPEPFRAVRGPATVAPLRHFFEVLWRSATPLRAYRGEHDTTLEMLARGFTDARIALALNVSARTVSRRVSEAMLEHGAGSRFELGMMYGRRRFDR